MRLVTWGSAAVETTRERATDRPHWETITADRGDLGEVEVVTVRASELAPGAPDEESHRPDDGDYGDTPTRHPVRAAEDTGLDVRAGHGSSLSCGVSLR
jgi:hypothetical protein